MSVSSWSAIGKAVVLAMVFVRLAARLPAADPETGTLPQVVAPAGDDVARLAEMIDRQIEVAWRENNITPAPVADDAEFLRRVTLDLSGRIPSVWDVREFLADSKPHKRRLVVDRLLESPSFYSYHAVKWRSSLLPQSGTDIRLQYQIPEFDVWLRHKLVADVGYDALVRDILAVPLNEDTPRTAEVFFSARGGQPDSVAAAACRLFLGVRLECAQCHDHPFSHWKQDDFWRQAAFFAAVKGNEYGQVTESEEVPAIAIPGGDRTVEAAFLGGATPELSGHRPREVFAAWLTERDNPYFARAGVNRVWAELFGIGIVDPPDDFDPANPPSHPELLDLLATEFAARHFDVPYLIRAITASRTYQLTSRQTDESQQNRRLFARHIARSMTADQLYDSLAQATGDNTRRGFSDRNLQFSSARSTFRDLFQQRTDRPAETQTSILQALALMNGEIAQSATDTSRNHTLAAVLQADFLTDAERIETLFLATLSRTPRPEEVQQITAGFEARSDDAARDDAARVVAFSDLFWALLNSSEFIVNH